MANKKPAKTDEPPFEDAMSELETIVRRLEQGGGELEQSLEDYAEAIELMKVCHKKLDVAERRIEVLSGVDAQGNPITQEVDEDELDDPKATRQPGRTSSKVEASGVKRKPRPEPEDGLF